MRDVMTSAEVGDDVWGDDPTVNKLEAITAELLGKAAGMFVPSGTQSNLCALLSHCQRGDEYIVGANAHTYKYEAGGAAVLGSIQPQPVPILDDGMIDLDQVTRSVKPSDNHFARSRLLCLENTHDGKVLSLAQMAESRRVADLHGLALHLDGARIWNASVALGVSPADVAGPFDTVSVCLSKGLGAPVGSVLVGPEELISDSRRWRKMLGGGMRQAGIIAAGGLYALQHNIDRLADDHANAAQLTMGLGAIDGVKVDAQNTNMVFVSLDRQHPGIEQHLESQGILTSWSGSGSRMVLHLDVSADDVATVVNAIAAELSP
jgi:threonine aldolase